MTSNDDILPMELMRALSRTMLEKLARGETDDTGRYMAGAADAVMFLVADITSPNFQRVLDAIRADTGRKTT